MSDMYDELEAGFKKLIDEYLSGKRNAVSCSILSAIYQIEKELLPYYEEMQKLDPKFELNANIGLVKGLISDRVSTPKKEQQVKQYLKKIQDIQNDLESNGEKKKKDISEISKRIDDLLMKIVGVLTVKK